MKRAWVTCVKWDRGWWHKYIKQARDLQYKSQTKTQAMSKEPVCRTRHWPAKNTKNIAQKIGKNDTVLIPVLN